MANDDSITTHAVSMRDQRPVHVLGIGASADDLQSLTALLRHIPRDQTAVVIIQHASPTGHALVPDDLASSTGMSVVPATTGARVRENVVYIAPPEQALRIDQQGTLKLVQPDADHTPRLVVDVFLRALAGAFGAQAVGVLLASVGGDGAQGLKEVKASGGITFVQDATTAIMDQMTSAIIEQGYVDYVVAPESVGEELVRLAQHPELRIQGQRELAQRDGLTRLFAMMRQALGVNLSYYKPSTLERRIGRRMALQKVETLADYVQLLERNPQELAVLYRDLLIRVTNFFRDGEPFEALKHVVLPRILQGKRPGDSIRIWSPGCSTGEEVYTIAITLLEFLGAKAADYKIQLFGTDLDAAAIQVARRGTYLDTIGLDVSPERLTRFFVKTNGAYQVSRHLREMIVFSTHDLTNDAPFSHLDLVSCRNVLIYLQAEVQRRVLRVFHYGLGPNGYLMLGNSEAIGDASDLFAVADRGNKIYSKRHVVPQAPLELASVATRAGTGAEPALHNMRRPLANVQQLADRKVLERYGPPGIVVSESFDIVQFRGRTGGYIEPAPGAATFNMMKLARPELLPELRQCIQQAMRDGQPVEGRVKLRERDESRVINIDVMPLVEPDTKSRCFLVVFRDEAPLPLASADTQLIDAEALAAAERVEELERELGVTKQYLQTTIEDLETSNEELKASNEELQSANEELQSTNEELETAKEELQATNEELTTVNEELRSRMSELTLATDDLNNILVDIDESVVVVDTERRIRIYSAAAERLLGLIAADVGRPVSVLDRFIGAEDIDRMAREAIESLQRVHHEVLGPDGRAYVLNVMPYKTGERAIRGAVIVMRLKVDGVAS